MTGTQEALAIVKPKAELVTVGSRSISTHGFRSELVREHLKTHLGQLSNQWCSIACLVRTFEGRNTKQGRASMRKRLPRLFKTLLDAGMFMAIDFAPYGNGQHGKSIAVKIYQPDHSQQDRQAAIEQLNRMRRRKVITDEAFERANHILGPDIAGDVSQPRCA